MMNLAMSFWNKGGKVQPFLIGLLRNPPSTLRLIFLGLLRFLLLKC
jgi:hypothetical protein